MCGFNSSSNSLCVVLAILTIAITIRIAKKISNPISNIAKHLQLMGNGDFSVEMDEKYLNINDEVGEMARSTKTMQSSLKDMLSKVQDHSNAINDKAENLHEVAESVATSSEEVANAVQDVSKGDVTNILSNFAKAVENMTLTLTDVQEKTNSINTVASEGNENMSGLVLSVESVGVTFKEFGDKLSALEQNVNKVNEITNLIDSIAEQTNLLALNAAIEAARAGESGRGFAVVADEIRKLSEQSKNSANEIAQLIANITYDTGAIIKNSNDMKDELKSQLVGINATIKSFKEIVAEIENIIPEIKNVNSSAKNINEEKENILDRVESISAISEETSASSEEMSATAATVFSTVDNLRDMAKDMISQVNNFKLK